jgi:mannose-6-phosphate isomerase-like protein (cupin superfamily)
MDAGYSVVVADEAEDAYAGSDVPGEFRSLTDALGAEQLAVTLIRVPPHSDFEQGTGHFHGEIEELYLVTRGTLTMRFGEEITEVTAGSAVRVAPSTVRSHRNRGDEPVEIWAVSRQLEHGDSTKVTDFWPESDSAS